MTAEYYAAHHACKQIVYFSAIYRDLGWPISEPVSVYIDCRSCIQLVVAIQVSIKSRHIEQWYYYICTLYQAVKNGVIHVLAAAVRADILTKVLPRAQFSAGACLFVQYCLCCFRNEC